MFSEKFVRKYMRMAKEFGTEDNPCYSRQIGVVIVDPKINTVVGIGYNGPPKNTPHCDSKEYLYQYFWPQLTNDEKLLLDPDWVEEDDSTFRRRFAYKYDGCQTCPRRLINAKSGERSSLCSCQHGERNAITNALGGRNTYGSAMFCWCGVPCDQCTGAIIQANIKTVYCLKEDEDYSVGSRFLFKEARIEVIELDRKDFE